MAQARVVAIVLLTAAANGCGLIDVLPVSHARTCAEWSHLGADARLQTADALIEPGLMASVRERQHLSADTPDKDVLVAVAGSFDKVCKVEGRPGLLLTEIVTGLYRESGAPVGPDRLAAEAGSKVRDRSRGSDTLVSPLTPH